MTIGDESLSSHSFVSILIISCDKFYDKIFYNLLLFRIKWGCHILVMSKTKDPQT